MLARIEVVKVFVELLGPADSQRYPSPGVDCAMERLWECDSILGARKDRELLCVIVGFSTKA